MPIPKEKLDEWIKELRNPNNKQITGHLKDATGYCCLGLFCEKVEGIKPIWDNEVHLYEFYGLMQVLPYTIIERYKIEPNGEFIDLKDRSESLLDLVDLNDSGFTFDQIADLLEHFDLKGESK